MAAQQAVWYAIYRAAKKKIEPSANKKVMTSNILYGKFFGRARQ